MVESKLVELVVAGSNPVGHPIFLPRCSFTRLGQSFALRSCGFFANLWPWEKLAVRWRTASPRELESIRNNLDI